MVAEGSMLLGPGVTFCPNPRMTLWNQHPRVFIDVATRTPTNWLVVAPFSQL